MKLPANNARGFTLIELVIIILVIGVLGTMAGIRMSESVETARFEQTKQEMEQLAQAIVGNPAIYEKGARSDFGFVGDNGVWPTNLTQLAQNPGGWSTWNGPYIESGGTNAYRQDAWGVDYLLIDTLIRSTGSGSALERVIGTRTADYLANSITGLIRDADLEAVPSGYADSLAVRLDIPNGAGGLSSATATVDSHGRFNYGSIPIGNHKLSLIYAPDTDTLEIDISVYPGRETNLDIIFPADLW